MSFPPLYYSKTCFTLDPQLHINPLILRRYSTSNLLIMCAREPQIKRVLDQLEAYEYIEHTVKGWWEVTTSDLAIFASHFNPAKISLFDAVIIIDPERIHTDFHMLRQELEHLCVLQTNKKDYLKSEQMQ